MEHRDEEDLRRMIRRELETREKLRGALSKPESLRETEGLSEERQRVIEDEVEAFYREKGGYVRFENEDGDVEWLTEGEIRERERQIPVDMEELEVGQRRVRFRLIALFVLAFIGALLLVFAMREDRGSLQVICNVPNAIVVLDGSPTELRTDTRLERISAGVHMVSAQKYGYVPDGPAGLSIKVEPGRSAVAVLKLKPGVTDSLGGQR